jgi:serine/threonine protein phosphatase 1
MRTKKPQEPKNRTPLIREKSERPRRVFAVGDIHGHDREVGVLLDHLIRTRSVGPEDLFIFMGDYIDRGPSSKQVIDRMLEIRRLWPQTVFLRGNHEDMLLHFLGLGGSGGEFYLRNGGAAFFESYGIEPTGPLSELIERLPRDHLEFIQSLEYGVVLAEFLFVHAGVAPRKPLEQQLASDLLWIRKEFVQAPHTLGKTVVFGHTAFNQIHLDLPYKIGIDTGVAYGNRLSIVELVQGELFQVDVGTHTVHEGALRDLLANRP